MQGAGFVESWASLIIGLVSGAFYFGGAKLLQRLHIDDPLEVSGKNNIVIL
jgi:ammonia channel protein AmtB